MAPFGARLRKSSLALIAVTAGSLICLLATQGQTQSFNPRDFSGVWWVNAPGPETIFARASGKDTSKCESCHPSEHTEPEPALTLWARQNAMVAERTVHGAIAPRVAPAPVNRGACEPIGVPAQFWYTQLYPFEFAAAPDRIFQFFEKQNEWRAIWMKRGHPPNPEPSYMGDSVGHWEGNTLIVDTIGFNGKSLLEPVGLGHRMSDSFHLVERWQRTAPDKLQVEIVYDDPHVWGGKVWGGLHHEFLLQPGMQLMEAYCTAEDNARFDEFIRPALK